MKKKSGPFQVYENDEGVESSSNAHNTDSSIIGSSQILKVDHGALEVDHGALEAVHEAPGTPLELYRKYECTNYQSCLEIAAALNWDSFSCNTLSSNTLSSNTLSSNTMEPLAQQEESATAETMMIDDSVANYIECNGQVDDALIWKAHLAKRDDHIADKLCELPEISFMETSHEESTESNPIKSNVLESNDEDARTLIPETIRDTINKREPLVLVEKKAFKKRKNA